MKKVKANQVPVRLQLVFCRVVEPIHPVPRLKGYSCPLPMAIFSPTRIIVISKPCTPTDDTMPQKSGSWGVPGTVRTSFWIVNWPLQMPIA
jgi:hypothetical protein